jgi:hypothetical protein
VHPSVRVPRPLLTPYGGVGEAFTRESAEIIALPRRQSGRTSRAASAAASRGCAGPPSAGSRAAQACTGFAGAVKPAATRPLHPRFATRLGRAVARAAQAEPRAAVSFWQRWQQLQQDVLCKSPRSGSQRQSTTVQNGSVAPGYLRPAVWALAGAE